MMTMKQYKRWQKKTVLDRLRNWRVVLVSGPRQCGKTTLISGLEIARSKFFTLDDRAVREMAETDPEGLIADLPAKTVIIDEVQKAKELMMAIKMRVDRQPVPGQFLLSGSADFRAKAEVVDSLAGRIAQVRMRTLTVGEMLGTAPSFFERAREKTWQDTPDWGRREIFDWAFMGGYPEAVSKDPVNRRLWHLYYRDDLIERDLQDIAKIRKVEKVKQLTEILAAWSTKIINKETIGGKLAVKSETLSDYIEALKLMYLFDEVPVWPKGDYESVLKKSKLVCTDTGLMTSVLNWNYQELVANLNGPRNADELGKLMETFVYNQLSAMVDLQADDRIFYYRDKSGREIDFLVETPDCIFGVEVKAAVTVKSTDADHLKWFRKNIIAAQKNFVGMVLYAGSKVVPLGEGTWAVPIATLWEG